MVEVWTAIGAISGILATVTVIVALFYARRQVSESKLARDATVLQTFQDRYHSKERREFRRRIYNGEFGPSDLFDRATLRQEDDIQFGLLIDELEFMAVLVDRKLLDFGLVVAAFRNTPPRMWRYLEPSIRRQHQNTSAPHYVHLEKLALRYDQHYLKHYGIRHPAFTEPAFGTAQVPPPAPGG
jgi:hypothetical protein